MIFGRDDFDARWSKMVAFEPHRPFSEIPDVRSGFWKMRLLMFRLTIGKWSRPQNVDLLMFTLGRIFPKS